MRLWIKGMLSTAAVCVGSGSALCVGGWAMGGRFSELWHRNYGITATEEGVTTEEETVRPPVREREEDFMSHHEEEPVTAAAALEGSPVYQGQEIAKLEISLSGGAVEVIWDDETDDIRIICENEHYQCYQEADDDTLEIRVSRKGRDAMSILDPETYEGWDETAAQILIPAGSWLEEAELEVKGGILTANRLRADQLDLEVDAGKVEVLNGSVRELNGQCRAGELIYEGTANQTVEAECMAGAVRYLLEGKKEDFNFEIEVLGGSIQVDGEDRGNLKRETVLNHSGAGKKAELECRAGAIKVDFYEGN